MHVVDENTKEEQRLRLLEWRIRVRQIGRDLGRLGMSDADIIPLLHSLRSVTFFTRDIDYSQPRLCHASYCLVYLDVHEKFTAKTIRRFLRHPAFRTWAKRRGKVIRVSPALIHVWRINAIEEEHVAWLP
jgi:hypothetical protein